MHGSALSSEGRVRDIIDQDWCGIESKGKGLLGDTGLIERIESGESDRVEVTASTNAFVLVTVRRRS